MFCLVVIVCVNERNGHISAEECLLVNDDVKNLCKFVKDAFIVNVRLGLKRHWIESNFKLEFTGLFKFCLH